MPKLFTTGQEFSFELAPGACAALPNDWVNTVSSLGHSGCVNACPGRGCEGQLSCVRFEGAGNLDFSNTAFNDQFNSFFAC